MPQNIVDSYEDSGRDATARTRQYMMREAVETSLRDADALELHAVKLTRRSRTGARSAQVAMLVTAAASVGLGSVAVQAPDGTYDGLLVANWSMLGLVVALGALNFAWGWHSSQRRLRETARRLLLRADHQRKMARARLTENP